MDNGKSDLINHLEFQENLSLYIINKLHYRKCFYTIFMQNERGRLCERASFVKTKSLVNIVCQHFPWRNLYIMLILKLGPKPRCCGNLYTLGDNLPMNLEGSKFLGNWMIFEKDWLVTAAFLFVPLSVRNIFFSDIRIRPDFFEEILVDRKLIKLALISQLCGLYSFEYISSTIPRNLSLSLRNYFSRPSKLYHQFV